MKVIDDDFIKDEYTKFIHIRNNSLSREICKEIIDKYENSDTRYEGTVMSGTNKQIKDTKDMMMDLPSLDRINILLRNELYIALKNHMIDLSNKDDFKSKYNNTTQKDYKINFDEISVDVFMAQKYNKGVGRYIYHNDSHIDWSRIRKRFMTYIWYLNDVDEGGETTFNGEYQIKPTAGKLVLFPACWTFPHCGKMPISNDKYIITGWIYTKNNC